MRKLLAILILAMTFVTISVVAWTKCTYTLKDTVYTERESCNSEPFEDEKIYTNWKSTRAHNKRVNADDYLQRIQKNPCLEDSTKCQPFKPKNNKQKKVTK